MSWAVSLHFELPLPKTMLYIYSVLLILISTTFIRLNGALEFNIKFKPTVTLHRELEWIDGCVRVCLVIFRVFIIIVFLILIPLHG